MDFHLHRKLLLLLCGEKKKEQSIEGRGIVGGAKQKRSTPLDGFE